MASSRETIGQVRSKRSLAPPWRAVLLWLTVFKCEFLQCTVLGKHGAVSDDVTLRGRDVIFFLKQAKIILRCRYAPGMPRPGVSK